MLESLIVLLLSDASGALTPMSRTPLSAGLYDEKWLQALLHDHPGLVPMDQIDRRSGPLVSLAREFALAKEGGAVFLDLLGVTTSGRIALVECKLWRNPQARREVLAQIFEYAALLAGWTYGDLTAKLKGSRGMSGANPIFEAAARYQPDLQEAAFVDAVSASLARGEFHLVIAGDGIRSDLRSIADHFNASGHHASRLSLVEVQVWSDAAGRTAVVSQLPVRTEVIEQRVLMGQNGWPIPIERPAEISPPPRDDAAPILTRSREGSVGNRQFWQIFIDTVRFDHPDQTAPRHGGNNWVRIDLPSPLSRMTAYRTQREIGVFLRFTETDGALVYAELADELASIRAETGVDVIARIDSEAPFKGIIQVSRNDVASLTDADQIAWVSDVANRLVTSLRPRAASWQRCAGSLRDTDHDGLSDA